MKINQFKSMPVSSTCNFQHKLIINSPEYNFFRRPCHMPPRKMWLESPKTSISFEYCLFMLNIFVNLIKLLFNGISKWSQEFYRILMTAVSKTRRPIFSVIFWKKWGFLGFSGNKLEGHPGITTLNWIDCKRSMLRLEVFVIYLGSYSISNLE